MEWDLMNMMIAGIYKLQWSKFIYNFTFNNMTESLTIIPEYQYSNFPQ